MEGCGVQVRRSRTGVGEFGGYVQQAVGSKFGEMRAKRLAQLNGRSDFVLLEIDHINGSAVGARLPDAGVAIDRYIGKARILGHGDLVAIHVNYYL